MIPLALSRDAIPPSTKLQACARDNSSVRAQLGFLVGVETSGFYGEAGPHRGVFRECESNEDNVDWLRLLSSTKHNVGLNHTTQFTQAHMMKTYVLVPIRQDDTWLRHCLQRNICKQPSDTSKGGSRADPPSSVEQDRDITRTPLFGWLTPERA